MFKSTNKRLIYIAVCISAILFFSTITPFIRPVVINILKYPLALITSIRREFSALIFYHKNFIENERLKKEVDFLKQKVNAAGEIYLENRRLMALFDLAQKSPYRVVASRIIGRPADSWSSVVIIDKGLSSGIRRGFVVINYLGLVGRIIDVTPATSRVMLINDPNLCVSSIVSRSRQEGLVCGTLGSSLIMRYLSKDSDIKVSDTVLTSGLTDNYPKGLLIGTIIDIGEEFSGLSRYAVIKPAVNLSNIEEVLVIIQ